MRPEHQHLRDGGDDEDYCFGDWKAKGEELCASACPRSTTKLEMIQMMFAMKRRMSQSRPRRQQPRLEQGDSQEEENQGRTWCC